MRPVRWGRVLLLVAASLACQGPGHGKAGAASVEQSGPQSNTDERRRLLAKAKDGDASAQYGLAVLYYGGHGVPQDDVEAARWFKSAAELGRADAQYYFGEMHYQGRGVAQDYARAAAWYLKAAEQGYAIAQANLGTMTFDGQGVVRDKVEGFKWETLAASGALGDRQTSFAATASEVMAKAMTAEEVAAAQRRARDWVSARSTLEDDVREAAIRTFCRGVADGRIFIELDGGPPAASFLARFGDPRYVSIAQVEMRKQGPFSSPVDGTIVRVGPIEWQSDHEAKLSASAYRGPLDGFGEQLLIERNGTGEWVVRVVPGTGFVS